MTRIIADADGGGNENPSGTTALPQADGSP
jgi:hypothetical protein